VHERSFLRNGPGILWGTFKDWLVRLISTMICYS
jgi:hypothetical protein